MKNIIYSFMICLFFSCSSSAQVDLSKLTPTQWEEDLNVLSTRMNKSFAGFTPEIKKQFNDKVEAVRQKLPQLNSYQVIMAFSKIVALLQDGHTEFNLNNSNTGFNRFPLVLYYFDNTLYVTGTDEKHKDMLGKRILKIGNNQIQEVLEKLKPYMNHDNDMEFLYAAPNMIILSELLFNLDIIKNSKEADFTVSDDSGLTTTHTLSAIGVEEYIAMNRFRVYEKPPFYLNNLEKNYWHSYLEKEKIAYFSIKRILNQKGEKSVKETIADFFKEVDAKKPDKVVIDFRLCPGGNYELALHIIEEIKKRPNINQKGKLFVATGRTTFSAALVTCIYLKTETNALLIGEAGRGTPNRADNVENYKLPNSKLSFDCTNRMKVHSEKVEKSDRLQVDLTVAPSFEAFKQGRDVVLESIIALK